MELRLVTSLLMDYYGCLLTDKQIAVMEMYFDEDLSLSEIADINGISRQAIHDHIKRTMNQLLKYEEKLGMRREADRLRALKEELRGSLDDKERLLSLIEQI